MATITNSSMETDPLDVSQEELLNAVSNLPPKSMSELPNEECRSDAVESITTANKQLQTVLTSETAVCKRPAQFTFFYKKSRRSDKKVFVCSLCESEFPTRELAFPHMNTHTTQCGNCFERFATKGQLWRHLRKHHISQEEENKEYLCFHCGDILTSEENLELHVKRNHEVRTSDIQTPFKCLKCNDQFSDWDSVRFHIDKHNEKDVPCSHCNQSFSNKATLWDHLSAVHSEKRTMLCSFCGSAFKTDQDLRLHENRHLNVKSFQCDQCSRSFIRKSNLKLHIRNMHSKRTFTCEHCGQLFDKLLAHSIHVTRVHVNKGNRHVCEVCNEPFENREALVAHRFTHENVVHECKLCKLQCSSRYNLRAHERTHTNKAARHKCKLCPMRFHRKIGLNLHMECVHDSHEVES